MKEFTRLLSLAVIGCSLMTCSPAKADTAYHSVYHKHVVPSDPFSILDKYQNNALTPEEYNNASTPISFNTVDTNKDGFITRSEFYAQYPHPLVKIPQEAAELGLIMPAAGGGDDNDDDQCIPLSR